MLKTFFFREKSIITNMSLKYNSGYVYYSYITYYTLICVHIYKMTKVGNHTIHTFANCFFILETF